MAKLTGKEAPVATNTASSDVNNFDQLEIDALT